MKTFLCEESVLRHNKTNCFPSYLDHYLNITDQSSIVCCYCCFLTFFLHYFYFCSFLIIKKNCPWTQSMTGGPWTWSMKVVHGPGPKWGSMDPWSMFCPHPQLTALSGGNFDKITVLLFYLTISSFQLRKSSSFCINF